MEACDETVDGIADALASAALYRLLAASVSFPLALTRDLLHAEVIPVLTDLRSAAPLLEGAIGDVIAIHAAPIAELRIAHGKIFTHIDSPDCPPYESAFCPGDVFRQAEVMADVVAFYRAHGLKIGGIQHERPDHVGTELEFMAFLSRKSAYAMAALGASEVEECERTQRVFLRDHLGVWGPSFASRLKLVAAGTPFEPVGLLLEVWLTEEFEWLDVEPVASWVEPQPMPELDDGSCGIDLAESSSTPVRLGRR